MNDLDAARIEAELDALGATIGRPLRVMSVTASTNGDARRAAAEGAPHGATFLADSQTAGRGRGGHVWHSPPGENLYMSVVQRPRVALSALPHLALVVGLAVARVVDAALACAPPELRAGIKWPNDVFVSGRKIAGVLVESSLRGDELEAAVAGVGINVRTKDFPGEIADRATSLLLAGARVLDRAELVARLSVELDRALAAFTSLGLAPLLGELQERDVLRGVAVRVGEVEGIAEGIDEAGRLCIRVEGGDLRFVVAGSVFVRGLLRELRWG
jgi:BirA family transcriptional regulator, biotin operon repressor / biotin---[acetyl-CoA-carboxylase] ligase